MAPSRGPNALARTLHATLANHKGPVHVVRYAKGSAKYVLTGGQDRTVRLWNPRIGTEIKTFAGHGYEVLSVSVYVPDSPCTEATKMTDPCTRSHDNSKFASSGGDRSVFLWDVATGVTTRRMAGHTGKVHVVEFNEDASVLASGECCSFNLPPSISFIFSFRILRLHSEIVGPTVSPPHTS
jgi:mitogen-activated protein kinase organizer 1